MMKKQSLIQLLTLALAVSACSKSVSLRTKAPMNSNNSAQNLSQSAAKANDNLTGKLLPFSKYDLSNLKSSLLYLNSNDSTHAISGIGYPSFTISSEKAKAGFVKQSNLTFRAIVQVPPVAAAMSGITSFKLQLKGVRLYDDGTGTGDSVLGKQVLCIADKQKCAGGSIDLTDSTTINKAWKSAQLTKAVLAQIDQFKTAYVMNDGARIYSFKGAPVVATPSPNSTVSSTTSPTVTTSSNSSTDSSVSGDVDTDASTAPAPAPVVAPAPIRNHRQVPATAPNSKTKVGAPAAKPAEVDLEIDLAKVFGIAPADLPQWILDNSTVYDKTGNYRKFLFELGNNLYVREGTLVFTYTQDARVPVPVALTTAAGAEVNGDWDKNDDAADAADYAVWPATPIDDAEIAGLAGISYNLDQTMISFTANTGSAETLSTASIANLTKLAPTLIQDSSSLEEIHIKIKMDPGADATASKTTGQNRATLLQTELTTGLQVTTPIKTYVAVEKTTSCGTSTPTCTKDQEVIIEFVLNEGQTMTLQTANQVKNDLDDGMAQSFEITPTTKN